LAGKEPALQNSHVFYGPVNRILKFFKIKRDGISSLLLLFFTFYQDVTVYQHILAWIFLKLGPYITDVRTKSRKIDPLPLCPQNVHTGSPSLVRADTPKISKNSKFFAPNSADVRIWRTPPSSLVRKMSALDTPPPPWLRSLLWAAPYEKKKLQTY